MVGRGLEPHPFGLQPSALPVMLTNHVMSVIGLEPMASGFVDQRSEIPPELHGQNQDGWIRTSVGLLPRQVGHRYPTS